MVRATQHEVARLAGVTRATVSYVLNGRAQELHISEPVVKRVREAAERLGYIGSHAARTLVSGKSYTLGLLSFPGNDSVRSVFWSEFAEGVQREALRTGYSVLLIGGKDDLREQMLRHLQEGRVDGLVYAGHLSREQIEPWPLKVPAPVVIEFTGQERLPRVTLDTTQAYLDAARRLRELGHRKILWIQPKDADDRAQRLTAVRHACAESGLTLEPIEIPRPPRHWSTPYPDEIAYWAARLGEIIPAGKPPRHTAILCWNDTLALGAYALLQQRGLRIPADMSVIGFDDFFAVAALPALASVRHELRNLGAGAVQLSLRLLSGELDATTALSTTVRVPATFMDRTSLGPANL